MAKRKKKEDVVDVEPISHSNIYIASGSTLFDLACTDRLDGFCKAGHIVNIIGDRNSGKTALSLASMAETEHRLPNHFKHKFIDYETTMSFDVPTLYGSKFNKALDVVVPDNTIDWCIEESATKVVDWCKEGPCFFVLDSVDVMKSRKEMEDIINGVPFVKEAYGGSRPPAMTAFFRTVCAAIARSGSFMIVLSQAKDNMGFGAMFKPKVRAGGSSLGFYAYHEIWLAPEKTILADKIKIGQWTKAKVERSKANGKKRTVLFPIMPAYGIDNTRANIEWLLEEKVISLTPGVTVAEAKEKEIEPQKKGLYDLRKIGMNYVGDDPYGYIEENKFCERLTMVVKGQWDRNEKELIDKTFGGRKGRYD